MLKIKILKCLLLLSCLKIQSAAENLSEVKIIKESEVRPELRSIALPTVLENLILDYIKSSFILKKTLKGHTDEIRALAVIDKDRLASASWDKTIRIWPLGEDGNLNIGKDFILGSHNDKVLTLEAINGKMLASGGADKTIKIWPNLENDAKSHDLSIEDDCIFALKYLSNDLLVSGSKTLKIWRDLKAGKDNINIKKGAFTLAYLGDDKLVFAGSEGFDLKILDINTGKEYILPTKVRDFTTALASIEGKKFASAFHQAKTIKIWDLTKRKGFILGKHGDFISALVYLKGNRLASCSDDKMIKIWDLNNNTLIQTLNCDFAVTSLATFENGDLAAGLKNGDILIFTPHLNLLEKKPEKPWYSKLKFWEKS